MPEFDIQTKNSKVDKILNFWPIFMKFLQRAMLGLFYKWLRFHPVWNTGSWDINNFMRHTYKKNYSVPEISLWISWVKSLMRK